MFKRVHLRLSVNIVCCHMLYITCVQWILRRLFVKELLLPSTPIGRPHFPATIWRSLRDETVYLCCVMQSVWKYSRWRMQTLKWDSAVDLLYVQKTNGGLTLYNMGPLICLMLRCSFELICFSSEFALVGDVHVLTLKAAFRKLSWVLSQTYVISEHQSHIYMTSCILLSVYETDRGFCLKLWYITLAATWYLCAVLSVIFRFPPPYRSPSPGYL